MLSQLVRLHLGYQLARAGVHVRPRPIEIGKKKAELIEYLYLKYHEDGM